MSRKSQAEAIREPAPFEAIRFEREPMPEFDPWTGFRNEPRPVVHYELRQGVNGSGNKIYIVVSVDSTTGRWRHTDTFKSTQLAEAWNWAKLC